MVEALAWRDGDRRVLWLANLTAEAVTLRLVGLAEAGRHLSVIDAAAFERAAIDPDALDRLARPLAAASLTLDAYGVARID